MAASIKELVDFEKGETMHETKKDMVNHEPSSLESR